MITQKKLLIALLLSITFLLAQTVSVRAKGTGKTREEAIENAKRMAIEQVGVSVASETNVENFQLVKDIIKSRAEGYINSYNIIAETVSGDGYTIEIEALVSKNPVDADVRSLSQKMGGVRFMVYYEPEKLAVPTELLEYTQDRINEFLTNHRYRCVEPKIVRKLIQQARELSGQSNFTKAQEIAYAADAAYYIEISNLSIRVEKKGEVLQIAAPPEISLELKLYDTGTGEFITGIAERAVGDSGSWNEENAKRNAIDKIVQLAGNKLIYRIPEQFGQWLNTGYPYQLRFFGIQDPDLIDQLIIKLREDPNFGGEMMPNDAEGYTFVNITYKGAPFDLNLAARKHLMAIPGLANVKRKLMVFNQINFAPGNVSVPEPRLTPLTIK